MSTPAGFLEELRDWYGETIPVGKQSDEYVRRQRAQAAAVGATDVNPVKFFEETFRTLINDLSQVLTPSLRQALDTQFAVGTLENTAVNAFICRQENAEIYGILVNRGFVLLLNHYLKLVQAVGHPTAVEFYQGKDLVTLDPKAYNQALRRLIEEYKASGLVRDPQLILHQEGPVRRMLEFYLRQVYLLLLAHEVGHYANGDLRNTASLVAIHGWAGARGLSETQHEQEFLADRFAFEAVLRLAAKEIPKLPAERLLSASATMLFNIFRDISDRGSETHPPSSTRLLVIIHAFFGEEAADLMLKSFDDTTYIAAMRNHIGSLTVKQLADRLPVGRYFVSGN